MTDLRSNVDAFQSCRFRSFGAGVLNSSIALGIFIPLAL